MMTKIDMLKMLKAKVSQCQKCPELVANRTQTVFDNIIYDDKDNQLVKSGSPNAEILFCGEAPGRTEAETGRPFVGPAGQLLTNMIKACGFNREDVYICNIIRCRPPNNRAPTKEEADNCRPFLELQLKIINPKYIVCLGNVAAQNLLKIDAPISTLRGQVFHYNKVKVVCTYHPSFLLRNQAAKKDAWDDLQLLLRLINEDRKQ